MSNTEELDVDKICRICLRDRQERWLIYDERPVEQGATIAQILNECTSYAVERFDQMPYQICEDCLAEARIAYRFKRAADQAYRTLVLLLRPILTKTKHNSIDTGTQTEQSSLYPCEICNEKYFTSAELRQHRNVSHQHILKCKYCDKMCKHLQQLEAHLSQTHQQQSNNNNNINANLQCALCERVFSRRNHLMRHMRNVHKVEQSQTKQVYVEPFAKQVTDADIEAEAKNDLQQLLEETEVVVLPESLPQDLDTHELNAYLIHKYENSNLHNVNDVLSPINPILNENFADNDGNNKIWQSFDADKFNESSDVDANFNYNNDANVELEPTGRYKSNCTICYEEFDTYSDLCEHMDSVHLRADLLTSYRCKFCKRAFKREYDLERHKNLTHKTYRRRTGKVKNNQYKITYADACADAGADADACADAGADAGADADADANAVEVADADTDAYNRNSVDSNKETYVTTTIDAANDLRMQIKVEPLEQFELQKTTNVNNIVGATNENHLEFEAETAVEQNKETELINVECDTTANQPQVQIVREYLQKTKNRAPRRKNLNNPDNRCEQCQRTFSRHCHLLRHQLSHLEQKPHSCPHCLKTFARSDHLKAHIQSLHGNKDYKCTLCDAAFTRLNGLERHKLSKHDGAGIEGVIDTIKLHNCEFCKKKFSSKSYLRKHTLMHTDLLYTCKNCDETFKERHKLREHEKTHAAERNFLCCICGDSFTRNDYLRVHMRRHNGEKPYKCKFCDKGFPRATDVKVHERYHTGTKPNLCNLCGKGFHRAYNLTIHMRTHTGERPYKCDKCPKSFTQSNDLKAHIRRHTGERYKCNECDACFLQLYAMRHHALSAHGTHIESRTGRLQRTGLLDDANSQSQITTVVLTTQNYNERQQQQQQRRQRRQHQQQHITPATASIALQRAPITDGTTTLQLQPDFPSSAVTAAAAAAAATATTTTAAAATTNQLPYNGTTSSIISSLVTNINTVPSAIITLPTLTTEFENNL